MTSTSVYAQALSTPAPQAQAELTPGETEAVAKLVAHLDDAAYTLDGKPLDDQEKRWLSRETLVRFYASVGEKNVDTTIAKLEDTLRFRRKLNIYDIDATSKLVENETKFGVRFVAGFHKGWPVVYVFPNKNQLPLEDRTQLHNVFFLERASDLAPAGSQHCVTVMNFGGKKEGPSPALSQTKEMLDIVGKHYPCFAGLSFIQEMGWAMRAFVNMIWPFIDAETKSRTKTVDGKQAIKDGDIAADSLVELVGGDLKFSYDHATYWPLLLRVCKERQEKYAANWKALGPAQVGRPEHEFKVVDVTV